MPAESKLPNDVPGSRPGNNQALTSWKGIAQFFGREVRTVQRWEKEEGLPVHRHLHQRQSSVYADPEELAAWWEERGNKVSAEPPPPARPRWRKWLWAGVAIVAALLAGAAAWVGLSRSAAPAAHNLQVATYQGTRPNGYLNWGLMGDLNGDGKDEVVFTAQEAREIYVILGGKTLPTGGALPDAADVVIQGTENAHFFAAQIADFNGDGIKDLLVAELLDAPEAFRRTGPSYILWGRRQWPQGLALPKDADVTLRLDWPRDARLRGCSTGKSSDLNGDGIDDVLLGASEYGSPDRKSSGGVFLVHGRRTWPHELEVASSADIILRGSRTGEGLAGPCVLGDFNGDGRVDLAIGAGEGTLWNLLGSRGRTYVFLGKGTWPRSLEVEAESDFRVDGVRPNVYAQQIFFLFADLNGDGRDDLVLAASRGPAKEDAGEVNIFFGGGNRKGPFPLTAADVVISGAAPGAELGNALLVRDFDNDGIKDLVLSEPGLGRLYLLYGRHEWKRKGKLEEFAAVEMFRAGPGAGRWQIQDGDFDGDGLPEIVFAAPNHGPPFPTSFGLAWVLKPYLVSSLDVRPTAVPNIVYYPDGICVARLYGFSHDARDQIDPATIRLAGAPPTQLLSQDYNGDGIPDLQLYFDTTPMHVSSGTKRIALAARTRSGLLVGGSDEITVIPTHAASSSPNP